ncbi:MAG: autoinducer binding domain-containing protein [Pseudorhodobacter sp.]|nr:autoinducer binding domain-containing protein [Pseudorhodobacter sp.]
MIDVSRRDIAAALLLSQLATICDRGFALAVHIRYTRPTLLYQTYARDWGDHYSEKGYMMVDPTVHWGLANTGAIDWSDLVPQDTSGVIAAAQAYGLTNGWTYAVGPATSRSLGSLTSSQPFPPEAHARCCAIIDQIHALTEGFDSLAPDLQDRLRTLKF